LSIFFTRSWIEPGNNPEDKDVLSKALAEKLHTPELVEKYKIEKAKNAARELEIK